MDQATFEQLLLRPEGETLDFKRDQYKLTNNDEKSELVKDILAFANTPREDEAFILIGVNDGKGSRAVLRGIPPADQLDDANVQGLINGKTNRRVEFVYEPFVYAGLTFGVLCIQPQDGFRYLEQDFGKLKRNHLYVRRGSSTCLLTPDEIYEMGAASRAQESPALALQIVGWPNGENFNDAVEVTRTLLAPPDNIPVLRKACRGTRVTLAGQTLEIPDLSYSRFDQNDDFFNDVVKYRTFKNFYVPFTFAIANVGRVAGTGVSFCLEATHPGFRAREEDDTPPLPAISRIASLCPIRRSPLVKAQFEMKSDPSTGRVILRSHPVDIPPGKTHEFRDAIYFGCDKTGDVVLKGKLYANNVPRPLDTEITIGFVIEKGVITTEDLELAHYWYSAGYTDPADSGGDASATDHDS